MDPLANSNTVPVPHPELTSAKTRFRSRRRRPALITGINTMCEYSSRTNASRSNKPSGSRKIRTVSPHASAKQTLRAMELFVNGLKKASRSGACRNQIPAQRPGYAQWHSHPEESDHQNHVRQYVCEHQ